MTTEVATRHASDITSDPATRADPAALHAAAAGLRAVAEQLNTELDALIRHAVEVGVPWSDDDLGERIGDAYRSAERMIIECVESNLEELRGFGDELVDAAGGRPQGLVVPGQLAPLVAAAGLSWPESDETGIIEVSQRWQEFSAPLRDLVTAAEAHRGVVAASDIADVSEVYDEYTGPDSAFANLGIAVEGVGLCATILQSCATAVLATKLGIVAVLAGHAAQVAQAQAAAERTLGASLAEIPAHTEVARLHITRLLSLASNYIDAEGEFDSDDESDGDDSDGDESGLDDEDDEDYGQYGEDDQRDTGSESDVDDEGEGGGRVVRVQHRTSLPDDWSPQQRADAIQRAFRGGQLNKEARFWWGSYRGLRIEGYYDPRANEPVVAYPGRMAPQGRTLTAADRVAFYYDADLGIDFGCPDDLDNLAFWVTSDLMTPDACLDALAGAADIRNRVIPGWEMAGNIWHARFTDGGTLHLSNEWNGQRDEYPVDDVLAVLAKYWKFITSDPAEVVPAVIGWEVANDRVHPAREALADCQIVVREPDDAAAADAIRRYAATRDGADFGGAGLDFRGADLRGLALRSATFAHAQLDRVDLRRCLLVEANLAGASAYSARFDNADLEDSNLRNLSAPSASFAESDLTSAEASDAYLRAANFRGACLFDTNFAFATLTDADLTDVLFSYTRLLDCHLEGAVLTGASGNVYGPVYVEPDKLLDGAELATWFRDNGADDVEVLTDASVTGH